MSDSSDTELELGQRSPPEVQSDTEAEPKEASPIKAKTPWDRMKSRSNKVFSKNYLQEMIERSPRLKNILKAAGSRDSCVRPHSPTKVLPNQLPRPLPEEDRSSSEEEEIEETLPEVATATDTLSKKKVSFNKMVHKRDIEVITPEELSSSEDDSELEERSPQETLKDFHMKLPNESSDSDDEDDDNEEMTEPRRNVKVEEKYYDNNDSESDDEEAEPVSNSQTGEFSKNSNSLNSGVPTSKQKSKFTITSQTGVGKNSLSRSVKDSSNSSEEKTVAKNRKKSLHLKNQVRNGAIINKKPNVGVNYRVTSSSESEESEKVNKTASKEGKSKSMMQITASSSAEDRSSSKNEKSTSKSKVAERNDPKSKVNTSPTKKGINSKNSTITNNKYTMEGSSSSSSETSEKHKQNISRNTSLSKMNKKDPKRGATTLLKKNLSDCSDSDSEDNSTVVKQNQPFKSESSGDEFQNPESNRNLSSNKSSLLNKNSSFTKNSSPTKSKKLAPNSSKSDVSDTDLPNKAPNEFLRKRLQTYSASKDFQKVTSKTYNLSRDLRNGDNEFYIVQIPKDLDPNLLANNSIFFDKSTVFNIENCTYALNLNNERNVSRVIMADSSRDDDNYFEVSSIRPTGILSICKENKLKKRSLKLHKEPAEEVIEEPKNLKEQHLLLGNDYEDRATLDKWISDKIDGLITSFNKKNKRKKSKKKSLDKGVKEQSESLDIFKLLDEHTEKKLSLDDPDGSYVKKKKKKKRKSDEREKSEMEESIDIINQLMLENEAPQEEEKSKTHKKEKHQRRKSVFEDNIPVPQEEITTKRKRSKSLMTDLAESIDEDLKIVKKHKKSKAALENAEEDLLYSDVPPKKYKKKGIVNSTMLSPVVGNMSIFDHEQSAIPKLDNDSTLDSFITDLVNDVDVKEKKKKRKQMESSIDDTLMYGKKKKKS